MEPTGSSLSDVRLAWVAGLFEGEGWIGVRGGRPTLQVVSTDEDVITRLAEWTGVGHVTGPHKGTVKPTWHWKVTKRDDAGQLLERLIPLLCKRRAQRAREVVQAWHAAGPTRGTAPTCSKGHRLEGDNLRISEGRRRCRQCIRERARGYRAQE